ERCRIGHVRIDRGHPLTNYQYDICGGDCSAAEEILTAKLTYTRDEIMADADYAQLQIEAGYRLHGGFDSSGKYISPRTLNRWPAVEAWQAELNKRGAPVIDASTRLLKRGPYPTVD